MVGLRSHLAMATCSCFPTAPGRRHSCATHCHTVALAPVPPLPQVERQDRGAPVAAAAGRIGRFVAARHHVPMLPFWALHCLQWWGSAGHVL